MPIHIVSGKPRNGKGLFCAGWMWDDELRTTDRPIVTNFAFELLPWVTGRGRPQRGLLDYLVRKYGQTFNAENRLFRLDEAQAAEFFRFRAMKTGALDASGKPLYKLVEARGKWEVGKDAKKLVGFEVGDFGLAWAQPQFYNIDEMGRFYSSRKWQRTGDALFFYDEQHGKLGDTVLGQCQHVKQIDPGVYRVAQDFRVCRNHSMLRVGLFKGRNKFSVHYFENVPSESGTRQKSTSKVDFKGDWDGLAQTYDTTGGVGIGQRLYGDSGQKVKGVPWWVLYVGAPLFLLLVWLGIRWGVAAATHKAVEFIAPGAPAARPEVAGATNSGGFAERVAANWTPKLHGSAPVDSSLVMPSRSAESRPEPVRMSGVFNWPPGHPKVFLSDGSTYEAGDGHLTLVMPKYCVVDGVTNWISHGPVVPAWRNYEHSVQTASDKWWGGAGPVRGY